MKITSQNYVQVQTNINDIVDPIKRILVSYLCHQEYIAQIMMNNVADEEAYIYAVQAMDEMEDELRVHFYESGAYFEKDSIEEVDRLGVIEYYINMFDIQ